MSAIPFDGGIGFAPGTTDPPDLAGGVFWAQGVGEVVDLSAAAVVLRAIMAGAAVEVVAPPPADDWPDRGVRAVVGWGGLDQDPIKVLQQLSTDREVYEFDFASKYLAQLQDTAATLEAFTLPPGLPGATAVAVGGSLAGAGGLVMFSIGPAAPVGVHQVAVRIRTTGGRTKTGLVLISVEAP